MIGSRISSPRWCRDWLTSNGIDPREIAVLTPRSQARSALAEGYPVGESLRLTWSDSGTDSAVRVSTVHSFKGLESPVVVLAETDGLRSHHHGDALTYVAVSRAKHHLVVVGTLPEPGARAVILSD